MHANVNCINLFRVSARAIFSTTSLCCTQLCGTKKTAATLFSAATTQSSWRRCLRSRRAGGIWSSCGRPSRRSDGARPRARSHSRRGMTCNLIHSFNRHLTQPCLTLCLTPPAPRPCRAQAPWPRSRPPRCPSRTTTSASCTRPRPRHAPHIHERHCLCCLCCCPLHSRLAPFLVFSLPPLPFPLILIIILISHSC